RGHEECPAEAGLVEEGEDGELDILDGVGDRVEVPVGVAAGPGLHPAEVIGEAKLVDHFEQLAVRTQDDVVVLVPDDVAELPRGGQASQVGCALDQGDLVASLAQTCRQGHPQHAAADHAPSAHAVTPYLSTNASTIRSDARPSP